MWGYLICLTNCHDGCLRVSYTVFYDYVNSPYNESIDSHAKNTKPGASAFDQSAYSFCDVVIRK